MGSAKVARSRCVPAFPRADAWYKLERLCHDISRPTMAEQRQSLAVTAGVILHLNSQVETVAGKLEGLFGAPAAHSGAGAGVP